MDHEPVTWLGAQRLAELLERIDSGRVDVVSVGGLSVGGLNVVGLNVVGLSVVGRCRCVDAWLLLARGHRLSIVGRLVGDL